MTVQNKDEEKNIPELIIEVFEEFLQSAADKPDYQKITDTVLYISGAKYAGFDLYDEDGKHFSTIAISSPHGILKKASSLLGFNLLGKKWEPDPVRAEKTRHQVITHFSSLSDLTGDVIPKPAVLLLEKTFGIGKVVFVKIAKEDLMIGNFTLIMPKTTTPKNDAYIEIYSRQLGLIITRKRSEDALKRSEAKFSKAFHSGAVLMAISTIEDGRYIDVNDAFLKTLGFTRDEVIGKKSSDLNIFAEIGQRDKIRKEFEINGKISSVEVLINGRDGAVHTGIFTAERIDVEGIQCWLTTMTDITDRKKTEDALRESEEKFRDLSQMLPETVFEMNLQGKLTFVNEHAYSAFGYTRQKFKEGINALDMLIPADRERAYDVMQGLYTGKNPNSNEYTAQRIDGSTFPILINSSVISSQGKVAGIRGLIFDITKSKMAEKALMESEKRYKSLFISSRDAILTLEPPDWKFTSANPSAMEMFNIESSTMFLPQGPWELSPEFQPDGRASTEKAMEMIETAMSQGSHFFEWVHKSINGREFITEVLLSRVDLGGMLFLQTTLRDITKRKQAQEEVIHLSFHDYLTGLYNRRFFEEEIRRLNTFRQLPLSIIMGDLNGLKIVNDVFGHDEGDKLLKEVTEILKTVCRSEDILARWGGDEFVILLPRTSVADSEEIVERIKTECGKTSGRKVPASLSLGAATKEKAGQDIQSVVIDAESNMYKNKLAQKESLASSIIFALERALYEKSSETKEHTDRMHELALRLGKSIRLSSHQLDELSLLASLHDIGKVAIPETILLKKGKLTEKEWNIIKRHPEIGFNIAQSSPQIAHIAKPILSCHENFDGSGYPLGTKGTAIPVISRIILIVDAYDVMTSGRSYKPAMSREEALAELKRCAGTQFDPELVDKTIEIISNK